MTKSKEEAREYLREYRKKPEVQRRIKEYNKKYYQKPEVKKRHRKYMREYNKRPEVKERIKKYFLNVTPEKKIKRRAYEREYYRKHYGKNNNYTKRIKESNKKYQLKHRVTSRGNPDKIYEVCRIFGISDSVSKAIALDGNILTKTMEKKGIFREKDGDRSK